MSYCRFTEGDVYAYACDGGVQFYVSDGKRELDRLCNTANEAYQYAKVLRDTHGLDVPNYAIEALKADAIEEAVRICGPNSAVSDLEAENAELVRVLHELEQEAVHAYRCLQHDCEQVLESEQHFFKKWWSSDCENAKLRKLVRDLWDFYCVMPDEPHVFKEELDFSAEVWKRMRELGIEVSK